MEYKAKGTTLITILVSMKDISNTGGTLNDTFGKIKFNYITLRST